MPQIINETRVAVRVAMNITFPVVLFLVSGVSRSNRYMKTRAVPPAAIPHKGRTLKMNETAANEKSVVMKAVMRSAAVMVWRRIMEMVSCMRRTGVRKKFLNFPFLKR